MKVNLYGEVIDVSDGEADGVIDFTLGLGWASECAPMGFAFVPETNDEWRTGYTMAAFGISDRRLIGQG